MKKIGNKRIRKQHSIILDQFKNTEQTAQQKLIQISNQLYVENIEDHYSVKFQEKTLPTFHHKNKLQLSKSASITKNDRNKQLNIIRNLPKTQEQKKRISYIDCSNYINNQNYVYDKNKYLRSNTVFIYNPQPKKQNFSNQQLIQASYLLLDSRNLFQESKNMNEQKKYSKSRKNKNLYRYIFNQNKKLYSGSNDKQKRQKFNQLADAQLKYQLNPRNLNQIKHIIHSMNLFQKKAYEVQNNPTKK